MKTRMVDASGNFPTAPFNVAEYSDPRVGVYSDGSIKVKGDVTVVAAPAAPVIADCTAIQWADTVVAGTGAAVKLSNVSLIVRHAILLADPNNPATVYVGPNASCRLRLFANGYWNIAPIDGTAIDLSTWYFNGAAGNNLIVVYVQ